MGKENLRCQHSHVRSANSGIGNASMESRYCNEHDCIHECRQYVLPNHNQNVPERNGLAGWVDHNGSLSQDGCSQSSNKRPAPQPHGSIFCRPFSSIVAKTNLKRKVDQDDKRHVVRAESLVQQLQAGDGIIGLETNLGDKMNNNDGLDVLEFQDVPHTLVDIGDAVPLPCLVFFLHESQADRDK